jgi:hypothetical protein
MIIVFHLLPPKTMILKSIFSKTGSLPSKFALPVAALRPGNVDMIVHLRFGKQATIACLTPGVRLFTTRQPIVGPVCLGPSGLL